MRTRRLLAEVFIALGLYLTGNEPYKRLEPTPRCCAGITRDF